MTASFVGATTGSTTSTHLALSPPAGFAAGDLLLLLLAVNDATVTITPPSGFTLVEDGLSSSGIYAVYSKVATGSEGAQDSVWGTSFKTVGIMAAYRGTDTTTPIAVEGLEAARPSGLTVTAPTLTTTVAGQMVLAVFLEKSSTNTAWTIPAGTTLRSEVYGTGGGAVSALLTDFVQASAGATGDKVATATASSPQGFGIQLALADAVIPSRTGKPKVWDGSAWVAHPAKAWSGSAWVAHAAKGWDGSAWVVGK